MAKPRIYKSALQVLPQRLKLLTDVELTNLMRELITAEGYRADADRAEIIVNSQEKAADDGADATTPAAKKPNSWFSGFNTCWQFKSGVAGMPSKLKGEVLKKIPKETLQAGGGYIVIASASASGERGRKERHDILIADARSAGLPTDKIKVLTSETLATWCNEFPSIAAQLSGMPDGLLTLSTWGSQEEHDQEWHPTEEQKANIAQLQSALDFTTGHTKHTHIYGPPGVGKTRLALELCKSAPWHSFVVYIAQAEDQRVSELIATAGASLDTQLVLVVDEVLQENLNALYSSVSVANGRIKLITIGHTEPPDPKRILPVFVKPLDSATCKNLVKSWHPGMSFEQIDFISWFSDGYVRLARLASNAVASDPTITTQKLLELPAIRILMDKLLGPDDRRPLYVVAVLKSVGWFGGKEKEGKAIAAHFGLSWSEVTYAVKRFDDRLRIAPRKGELRYISPEPLGVYLACEARDTFQSEYESLPAVLETEQELEAYYERLEAMAGHPGVKKHAREDLLKLFKSSDFRNAGAVRRWESLTAAQRTHGLHLMYSKLSTINHMERIGIAGDARRRLVWALIRFAWFSDSFREATLALAELAEAENETWANNATGEFIHKFQVALGGTEVPYVDRLEVLDELAAKGHSYLKLVVKALSKAGDLNASRAGPRVRADAPLGHEWQPKTTAVFETHSIAGIEKLTSYVDKCPPDLIEELVKAAQGWVMLLRRPGLRRAVAQYFQKLAMTYPSTRELLRGSIARTLNPERKYWQELGEEAYRFVQELHDSLVDASLDGQLRQKVTDIAYDDPSNVLHSVATQLLQNPQVLRSNWAWLTSGNASGSWLLGKALGEQDKTDSVLPLILELATPANDTRVVASYLVARSQTHGPEWLDDQLDAFTGAYPDRTDLVIELTWRCNTSSRGSSRIEAIVRSGKADTSLSILQFGPWSAHMPRESFLSLLDALVGQPALHATAVAFLSHRLDKDKDIWSDASQAGAILAASPKLIRSHNMTSYYWEKVATRSIDSGEVRAIVTAIFKEQTDRSRPTWFIEHSQAANIVFKCIDLQPEAVWQALKEHLSSYAAAMNFSIGFPPGIIDRLPKDQIIEWVDENPSERALSIARFVGQSVGEDSLTGMLIERYSGIEGVGNQIFSQFINGVYMGPSSDRWSGIASHFSELSKNSKSSRIKAWAAECAYDAREMAERYRESESEEELRGH